MEKPKKSRTSPLLYRLVLARPLPPCRRGVGETERGEYFSSNEWPTSPQRVVLRGHNPCHITTYSEVHLRNSRPSPICSSTRSTSDSGFEPSSGCTDGAWLNVSTYQTSFVIPKDPFPLNSTQTFLRTSWDLRSKDGGSVHHTHFRYGTTRKGPIPPRIPRGVLGFRTGPHDNPLTGLSDPSVSSRPLITSLPRRP